MNRIKKHQHRWFFTFMVGKDVGRFRCKHCDEIKYKEFVIELEDTPK